MSGTVVIVVAGAMVAGVAAAGVVAFFVTTSLIELYVRNSRWKDYSLPIRPWVRGPNMM